MAMMNYMALWISVAIVFSVQSCRSLAAGEGSKEADKISALPGQPPDLKLQQYSGYINVNQTNGKSLFYYFVEASADADQKPLVLWLNGGPGCSSLGIGAFQEIGPFRVDTDGKTLCRNTNAWNTEANVLFLESPVGVGFSYAAVKPEEVYSTMGDNMTAHDSYAFLLRWLDRFPEYKTRDLYIFGESYAGHYVPELAVTILASNKLPDATHIKLKGIAIGNGILELAAERTQLYEYLWQHAFISDSGHALIAQSCQNSDDPSPVCESARNTAYGQVGSIDIYNIYSPPCHDTKVKPSGSKCTDLADPCAQYYVEAYLNQPQVQKAIHANTELEYPWTRCRTYNLNHFGDSPKTMLPHIKALISSGAIRIWIFSGDLDAMVPVTATRQSMERLQLRVAADWRPWSADGKFVAGSVITYEGLVFATVRGSGHMIPIDQPERALVLLSSFLRGQPLPRAPYFSDE
ncbi:serine carboxypeptidase 1-like [Oryza brachyantha]|uniref:serine carboxypeptidase 1-like n=1 Tax=Oryza brachyantha TaxID=4533 RepID=UPI001ADAB956|nr:serine carboxypeptidase 1-like [Oryza brachyantha]